MADRIITPCNVARSWHWFRQVTLPCNVACGSGIMTVNSPSGSTLQCDTWLWDDMLSNSPKRPPYWNSISGFDFDHITPVNQFNSRLAAQGPNSKWNASEIVHKNNNEIKTNNIHNIGAVDCGRDVQSADMSFCTSLRNFIQIGSSSSEKKEFMSIFKMADLSHLGY